jgi:MFS family permease
VLAVRSFRLLTGGQFASTIGDLCYAVALPWLVLSSHRGPVLLGAVLACYGVPRTVLIPAGGVLADKVGPRTLIRQERDNQAKNAGQTSPFIRQLVLSLSFNLISIHIRSYAEYSLICPGDV